MKKRKVLKSVVSLVFILTILTVSAVADGLTREIQATEAKNIYLNYNGEEFIARDANDNVVYPIVVNGTSYLPVRAVCAVAGLNVDWDGNSRTVLLTSSDYVKVDNDGYVEEQEINDTKADANLLDIEKGKAKGRVGAVLSTGKDKNDLWKFVLSETGIVSIVVTGNKGAQSWVTIRDDSGGYDTVGYHSMADPSGLYQFKLALRAGTYYIDLNGDYEEMPYKIDLSFTATPDDYEDDDSVSDAEVFDFNGIEFVNKGAVGAGNDIYVDHVILENFNQTSYEITLDWIGKSGGIYVDMYDADGNQHTREEFRGREGSEKITGTAEEEIAKMVFYINPGSTDNICNEYTITVKPN